MFDCAVRHRPVDPHASHGRHPARVQSAVRGSPWRHRHRNRLFVRHQYAGGRPECRRLRAALRRVAAVLRDYRFGSLLGGQVGGPPVGDARGAAQGPASASSPIQMGTGGCTGSGLITQPRMRCQRPWKSTSARGQRTRITPIGSSQCPPRVRKSRVSASCSASFCPIPVSSGKRTLARKSISVPSRG